MRRFESKRKAVRILRKNIFRFEKVAILLLFVITVFLLRLVDYYTSNLGLGYILIEATFVIILCKNKIHMKFKSFYHYLENEEFYLDAMSHFFKESR